MLSTKIYAQISDLGYFLPWEIEDKVLNMNLYANFFLFTSYKQEIFYKKSKINFKKTFLCSE